MNSLNKIFAEKMGLTELHFQQFQEISKVATFRKNDYLLEENKVCTFLGFVESGVIRSYIQKDGNEFNNDFLFPGSFVCAYRSFTTQTPAYSTIQALSDSEVRIITYRQLQNLVESSDSWYRFGKHISDELFIKKCTRESSLLRLSAKERYELLIQTNPEIEQLVSQYQIASYLRIKPESLSRIKALTYINK